MSAHTPGPWHIIDGFYPAFREVSGPSFKISVVLSASDLTITDYLQRTYDLDLIAAAPELLEALIAITSPINSQDEEDEVRRNAQAAIAKAHGVA